MKATDARTTVGRGCALVAAVGPVYYIVLTTVLGMRWPGYDPTRDTQSELGAVDSPYRTAMNVGGFMVLGACILALAIAYAVLLRGRWVKWLAVALLVMAGTGMVIVGFFPCDAGCVDVTTTGRLHGAFSAPGAIGLLQRAGMWPPLVWMTVVALWLFVRGSGWPSPTRSRKGRARSPRGPTTVRPAPPAAAAPRSSAP